MKNIKKTSWFNNFLFICQKNKNTDFNMFSRFLALIINCRSHSFYKNNLHVCALVCQINKNSFPLDLPLLLWHTYCWHAWESLTSCITHESFIQASLKELLTNYKWNMGNKYTLHINKKFNKLYSKENIYIYKRKQIHSHTYTHKFINVKKKYICLMSSNICSSK